MNRPQASDLASGRRFADDRRLSLQAVNLRHLGLQGRRQSPRRAEENGGGYVDWYEPQLALLGIAIILCSCLDAFFTINLMQAGAVELNVLMARLIETDIQNFVNAKIALTCLCVTLLVIHKNFRVFMGMSVKTLLQWILVGYVTLIGWELFLLSNPPV
ncbi:MAG: hypothetical protein KJO54_10280 [Gammaproteobacteria bacterium]|nr:hypothetical protein [Gammaproteobacteria bacterium]NNF61864.1 hypothetical protein [Gammaproteobacteria bacterium]